MRSHIPTHPFFVYGTLIPGQPNGHHWQNAIISYQPATFYHGRLYAWPTFPILLEADPAAGGMPIEGVLVEVDARYYTAVVAALDQLENYNPADEAHSPYLRRTRRITLASGQTRVAWLYLGQRPYLPPEENLVQDGDWLAHCRRTATPDDMAAWWATRGRDLLF